jgi:hypothetical protein
LLLFQVQEKSPRHKEGQDAATKEVLHRHSASILIPLAIFAGGNTLATQFIIQCPNTRLQALLALASRLFLATPLALLPVYLVLYGLKDEGSISYESQRHAFVCTQLVISGIMLSTAFVLLGTAIYVADETEKTIGSWGLGLLTLLLLLGFWKWLPSWPEIRHYKRDEKKKKSDRIVWPSVWRFVPLALLQLTVMCLLLGFGGRAAPRAPHQYGCNTTSAVGGAAVLSSSCMHIWVELLNWPRKSIPAEYRPRGNMGKRIRDRVDKY